MLSEGNFEEGWRLYEERWRTVKKAQVRRLDAPLWTRGGPLPVGTLLVHAEQGLGDVIQMSRYVAIAAESARVIVEAPAPLVPLLRTLADPSGRISVVASGETLPAFDAHCPVMSLPLAFGTKLSDIPASVPYLHPAPERRTHWAARLGERKRPRVGIAWSGSRIHGKDSERSLKLTQLGPLFALPIEFHALQTDVRDEDLPLVETLGIADHRGDLRDFADTAALAAELDLVVSVDTSVAHLAGALGLPVWILLADPAEFRWLHGRRDSPWYPSATLFRQPTRGAWSDVVAEVAQELARRFAFDPAAS